jgi:hypothetical protein
MLRATIAIAAGLAFAAGIPIAPAQAAGAARTFLSAAGSDSNNCTNVATPCRHLAAAFAATATDGEIYVLDPANYGSLTITHGVSIEGHGWASIAPVTGQAAITINAPSGDRINIIGVVLDGTAVAGTTGIQFNSGGSLTVRDSVVRNFSNYGIDFVPNNLTLSQLFVSNTVVSDNITGIFIEPTGSVSQTMNGVLNHVEIENNASDGLRVSPVALTTNLTVSDSVSANNAADGIHTFSNGGALVSVMVRNSTIANNGANGLDGGTGSTIRVTRSTITGNATGWAGVVLSYADNNIDGNGAANTEPPSPLAYK